MTGSSPLARIIANVLRDVPHFGLWYIVTVIRASLFHKPMERIVSPSSMKRKAVTRP
jgi:hypothetical protein